MVTSGTYYNGGCSFDYGNAEQVRLDESRQESGNAGRVAGHPGKP